MRRLLEAGTVRMLSVANGRGKEARNTLTGNLKHLFADNAIP